MAKLGTVPVASRYDGIAVGPTFVYSFETQEGIPVDGTNAMLRALSPFTIRLIVPDALLEMAAGTEEAAIDLIQAAALGSDTSGTSSSIATALSTVMATGTSSDPTGQLQAFVSAGQFYTDSGASFVSSLADAYTASDIALQVQAILNAEPLVLLVNPSEMTVAYSKLQSYQSRTRYGFEFEAWGEDQVTITFSGSTAGFVAGAVDVGNPSGGQVTGQSSSVSGYTGASKRDSAAWQNFMSLYHFYKNNGYIFDTVGKSMAHLFVGSVAIDFDQWTYVGHIESFSYRFEEGSPHRVTFDMEFKASKMYDLAGATSSVQPIPSPTGVSSSRVGSALVFSNGSATGSIVSNVEYSQTPLELLGDF